MSQTHDEIRALRVMVDELRAEPPPNLDWDAVEQRLLSRIGARWATSAGMAGVAPTAEARDPSPVNLASARARAHTRTTSPLLRVFGFAAAAAVLALGVGSMTSNSALPSAAAPVRHVVEASLVAAAPGNAGNLGARDLSTLRPGDVVEAGDAPVSFAEAGLAQWTLAPGSSVRVRSVGVGHTVVLERGSLRAEVTPRDPSEGLVEAFAVEVGGTRVAVHGTAFSVAIEGNRAVVDVEHGAVAVGPVGYAGATTGHLLVGPSRASFSLDGGRSARLMERVAAPVVVADARQVLPVVQADAHERPAPTVEDVHEHLAASAIAAAPRPSLAAHAPANPVVEPAAVESAPPAAVPEVAAAALPPLTAGVVQARLARCLKHDPAADPGAVRVSVSSMLHIELNADGSFWRAHSTPALRTDLTNCFGGAIAGRYGGTVRELDVPITFQP